MTTDLMRNVAADASQKKLAFGNSVVSGNERGCGGVAKEMATGNRVNCDKFSRMRWFKLGS
jgi:hypothetical protein